MLLFVSALSAGVQLLLVEFGGDFVRTSPLSLWQWIISVLIGSLSIPMGVLMRLLVSVQEDPDSFFTHAKDLGGEEEAFVRDISPSHMYDTINMILPTLIRFGEY